MTLEVICRPKAFVNARPIDNKAIRTTSFIYPAIVSWPTSFLLPMIVPLTLASFPFGLLQLQR